MNVDKSLDHLYDLNTDPLVDPKLVGVQDLRFFARDRAEEMKSTIPSAGIDPSFDTRSVQEPGPGTRPLPEEAKAVDWSGFEVRIPTKNGGTLLLERGPDRTLLNAIHCDANGNADRPEKANPGYNPDSSIQKPFDKPFAF